MAETGTTQLDRAQASGTKTGRSQRGDDLGRVSLEASSDSGSDRVPELQRVLYVHLLASDNAETAIRPCRCQDWLAWRYPLFGLPGDHATQRMAFRPTL